MSKGKTEVVSKSKNVAQRERVIELEFQKDLGKEIRDRRERKHFREGEVEDRSNIDIFRSVRFNHLPTYQNNQRINRDYFIYLAGVGLGAHE